MWQIIIDGDSGARPPPATGAAVRRAGVRRLAPRVAGGAAVASAAKARPVGGGAVLAASARAVAVHHSQVVPPVRREQAAAHQLPDTGIDVELEKLLSSCFIHSEKYGTRCSSILLLEKQSKKSFYNFYERSFTPHSDNIQLLTEDRHYRIAINE